MNEKVFLSPGYVTKLHGIRKDKERKRNITITSTRTFKRKRVLHKVQKQSQSRQPLFSKLHEIKFQKVKVETIHDIIIDVESFQLKKLIVFFIHCR